MAKPDLDDGWLPYAHELDAALAVADFGKGARIVLREVFSQCFGLAKGRTATLSPAEIGARVGLLKEHVVRAIGSLVSSRVLVRVARGEYRFVKDYEGWIFPDGSARLSKTEIAWCRSAPYVALAHTKARKNVLNMGAPIVPNGAELGAPIVPKNPELGGANRSQLGAPIVPKISSAYRNGRGELETENGLGCSFGTPGDVGTGAGERSGTKRVSIKDLIIEAKALHGEDVARQVMTHSQDILGTFGDDRLDCYLAAIREAASTQTTIKQPHRWFLKVGKGLLSGDALAPAQIAPRASRADDRRRKEAEAIDRAVSELPEDL